MEHMQECVKSMVFPWISTSLKAVVHSDAHLTALNIYEHLSRAKEELELLTLEKHNLLCHIGKIRLQ